MIQLSLNLGFISRVTCVTSSREFPHRNGDLHSQRGPEGTELEWHRENSRQPRLTTFSPTFSQEARAESSLCAQYLCSKVTKMERWKGGMHHSNSFLPALTISVVLPPLTQTKVNGSYILYPVQRPEPHPSFPGLPLW